MSSPDQSAERLCRIIAALNYDGQQTRVEPRSFSKPNFTLVYDLLKWFARILVADKYGDDLSLPIESALDNDEKRTNELPESSVVNRLINLGKLFRSKLGIHLNLVQLYKADSNCCAELLSIAEPIYKAAELVVGAGGRSGANPSAQTEIWICEQDDLRRTLTLLKQNQIDGAQARRDLTNNLGELAEKLEVSLENEQNFNEIRKRVIDQHLELADVERLLVHDHGGIIDKTAELAKMNEELCKDLDRLDERLRAKEMELDGIVDRLNDLLIEAPQYLGKFERLYKDYEISYEEYVSNYRNVTYLESCVYWSDDDDDSQDESLAVQLEAAAKPLGSTAFSLGRDPAVTGGAGTAAAAAAGDGGLLALSAKTVGPARLAESLPEGGGSKPRSESLGVEAVGAAGAGVVRTRYGGAGAELTGRREMTDEAIGRRRLGKAATGDSELDGLLKEFEADSEYDGLNADDEDDDGPKADEGSACEDEPDGTSDEDDEIGPY